MQWEKNKIFAVFFYIFLWWERRIAVNYLFTSRSQYSYEKEKSLQGFEPLPSFVPSTANSTAPTVNNFFDISREIKLDWVNVGKQMR